MTPERAAPSPGAAAGGSAEAACRWLAFGVPLLVTATRVPLSPQWRDDVPVLRGLGGVPLGPQGTLSSVLIQAVSLVPLAGRLMRAAWVSGLGVALSALALYFIIRRLLDANAWTPTLSPALALAGALLAALSPCWQLEGVAIGGASVACAVVLLALLPGQAAPANDARLWLVRGALVGLACGESVVAGLALVASLGARVALLREALPRRFVLLFFGSAAVVLGLCALPWLLGPSDQTAWFGLLGVTRRGLASLDSLQTGRPSAAAAWLAEVGLFAAVLAGGGALWGTLRTATRRLFVPLLVFVAADVAFPVRGPNELFVDVLTPLRLLGVTSLAVAASLGVHTLSLALRRAQLPLAESASVLFVVLFATMVLVTSEDAGVLTRRHDRMAAEAWTDEALAALPPRSLLLARSPALIWRLWAARVVRGERPDLVLVPAPVLGRSGLAQPLLQREPELVALVRETAMNGSPGEYALSTLADARPLYVELDPSWDRRLYDQLVPGTLWLGVAPHALGRSDRRAALEGGRDSFRRIVRVAGDPQHLDPATLGVLAARAREQALVLAALGDRKLLSGLLDELDSIDPGNSFSKELRRRLGKRTRGAVDVTGLLEQL
ncbi:MAG: hypothetical protein JW940_10700 [Polyangiaceae bacterium]|nr:hypothetical protein [Polyangiaceae bacterium]